MTSEQIIELLHRNLQEVFGEGDAARRRAAIDRSTLTIAYSMFRQACSSDATLWTSSLVTFARPTRILLTRLMEKPKLFTTLEFSPGVRGREAKLPITLGWTSSLSATEGLLRYTFSSIQNSCSSARYEP